MNTATVRNVTGAEKLAVYRRYGMTGPSDTIPGTNHQGPFEVDHRLPLCAGGANDITNLWIQASDGPWTFHDKDRLEDRICAKLKRGVISVEQAQAVFLGDWKAGYVAEFGGAPAHEGEAGH
ncbi:HNH endonuclease [Methylobacterium sp. P1-11]|uniref:HNH endonuclease signature motif containing protein n=1 Tax=Methylobacterium sp. P1-11 TaxID=2024616 RepID=UPI0011EEFA03|nr:HNH endonuclease signature motif containing protein [Methylobacterium sp. P1-11]KAA0117904.1 HNH endonuclease [Methylobacterium sp. P1-11]